jgi:hypothetical protein
MAFECKIEKSGNDYRVKVSGSIDEDSDFSNYSLQGAGRVLVDAGSIKSINSCGIREWIKWIATAGNSKVEYAFCPKVIVDQINMVQGFLPSNGVVQSFYVPFYSETLDQEQVVLFQMGKEYTDQGLVTIPVVKDKNGNEMEIDVVEAKYFKFLKK